MYDQKVRIGARLANGKVLYLGQCVLHQLTLSLSAGKFRAKEIAPNPEEDTRLAGVAHGGIWKEDGRSVGGKVAQTELYVEGRRVGCGVCA